MFIDEWDGWRWTCWACDHVGPEATDAEIKAQEKEEQEREYRAAAADPRS